MQSGWKSHINVYPVTILATLSVRMNVSCSQVLMLFWGYSRNQNRGSWCYSERFIHARIKMQQSINNSFLRCMCHWQGRSIWKCHGWPTTVMSPPQWNMAPKQATFGRLATWVSPKPTDSCGTVQDGCTMWCWDLFETARPTSIDAVDSVQCWTSPRLPLPDPMFLSGLLL